MRKRNMSSSSQLGGIAGLGEALAIELKPLGIHATVVERGFFRTDFLDTQSLSVSPSSIADYHETAGAMRPAALPSQSSEEVSPKSGRVLRRHAAALCRRSVACRVQAICRGVKR
jgi:hypothetical protein